MFGRYLRAGVLLLLWAPIAIAQGQDSPRLARALERAEKFDAAMGPKPQPTAKWVGGDRLAYFFAGAAPWTVLEAATGQVLQSEVADAAVGGPGPAVGLPLGLASFGPANPGSTKSGPWTAQMANGDLVVSDAAGATRLTLSGAENYGWGLAPRAWSPDGQLLVAVRLDNREIHRVPIIDYSSPIERVTYAPYPKTGTQLPVEELHIVDPVAAVARPVQLDTRDATIWFLGWRSTVAEAIVMRLSRTGKRLDLLAITATGATRPLAYDERPATFVGALDFTTADWPWQVTLLPDENGFLWMSERDGWRHVYHYGYDGALKKQVTSGAFPVHRVVHIDSARRQIHVLASGDSARPYDRHAYRVGLDGTGFTALTSTPGQHEPVFSSSGNFFVDSYSSLAQPHTVELRRADGTLIKRLGQASAAALAEGGYTPPESFRVKAADGTTDVYGVLYKPTDFDATKRYPIVDYIYAGPFIAVHQTTYMPTSAMHRISAALAQMGFVVAMLDARGTPGRGKAFQDANYGRIGQIEIPDHVAALRELGKSRPYIDTTRAGIVGHSWGGYFALRGMLTAPDFFKVGYAGAPGDLTEAASINEPNMGLLSSNQAGYVAGSNPGRASELRGRLKIMHGTSDVMAPLSTTMRMVWALIEANKTVDLLIMPGQPHGPQGAAGRYYREDVRRFMATHLGEPRSEGEAVSPAEQQPAATGTDWPQWRGPARDGFVGAALPAQWPEALKKRWEIPIGTGHASPVVSGNRVVVIAREGDQEIVRALDVTSGKEIWRAAYPAPYIVNPAAQSHGSGPKSTPAIAGGRVFTFGVSGILSAFDLATGKLIWRVPAPAVLPEYGTATSPLLDGTSVIAHVGGYQNGALTSFDAATGKPRWQWTGDGPGSGSPIIATFGGVRQVIAQTQKFLVGLNASTGALLWQMPFTTDFDQNAFTPVVFQDLLINAGIDWPLTAIRPKLAGGKWIVEVVWTNPQTPMFMSSPVLIGGTIYGLTLRSRGQFVAIDAASGKTLWNTQGREGENASMLGSRSWLLASTTDGNLVVARANPQKYEEVRRYQIAESALWAHPAITGRSIIVKDVDKVICWSF